MAVFGVVQYGAQNVQTLAYAKCRMVPEMRMARSSPRANREFLFLARPDVTISWIKAVSEVQIIVNILKDGAFGSYEWVRARKFDMTSNAQRP
jgi:hypothetical protein